MPGPASPTRRHACGAVAIVVSAIACAALAGCDTGPTAQDERQALVDELIDETDGALGRDAAECVAERLQDRFGEGSFQEVIDAAVDGEDDDPVRAEVIEIFAACDALKPIATSGP